MVETPEDYLHSSYRAYAFGTEDAIISKGFLLGLFDGNVARAQSKYRSFVYDGVVNGMDNPLDQAYAGAILGDEDFVNEVLAKIGEDQLESEDVACRKALSGTTHAEALLGMVSEHFRMPLEEVLKKGSDRRKICIYLLKRHTDATNERITELIGAPSYSSIAKVYQRFVKELDADAELKREVRLLEQSLSLIQA